MASWGELIKNGHLTVKGDKATVSQAQIMLLIHDRGRRKGAGVEDVAGAIATAVQESKCTNITTPNEYGCAGIFQQMDRYYGGYANTVNPTVAADAFYTRYLPFRQRGLGWLDASDKVQSSGHRDAPSDWWEESLRAARFFAGVGMSVTAKTGTDVDGGAELSVTRELPYEFERGSVDARENSLEFTGRLADEVDWNRFIRLRPISEKRVRAEFAFISDPWLAAHKPRYKLSENSRGVLDIGFTIEGRLPASEGTMLVVAGLYDLQIGMVVELFDEGPGDGDWLVSGTRATLTSPTVEVSLKRPGRKLPEPAPQLETLSGTVGAGGSREVTGGAQGLQGVPEKVRKAYAAADYYTSLKMPYAENGVGRHGLVPHPAPKGDCSSGVDWVLWQAEIALPGGVTSGWAPSTRAFPGWGEPGKGKYFTVWVKYLEHIWIQWYVGTAWRFDTGGGLAPHQQHTSRSTDGFVALHAPGC